MFLLRFDEKRVQNMLLFLYFYFTFLRLGYIGYWVAPLITSISSRINTKNKISIPFKYFSFISKISRVDACSVLDRGSTAFFTEVTLDGHSQQLRQYLRNRTIGNLSPSLGQYFSRNNS